MQKDERTHQEKKEMILDFRKTLLIKQWKIVVCGCVILMAFSAVFLTGGFLFHMYDFVKPTHLMLMYGPIGLFSLACLLVVFFLKDDMERYWKVIEIIEYLFLGILPYWGLLIMVISVIEGRKLNFIIWMIGILVSSSALCLNIWFCIANVTVTVAVTMYSMYLFQYGFGESGMMNLVILSLICIWIAVIRFRDEYSLYQKKVELEVAMKNALLHKEEADHANYAKGVFLAHMSHEIRTPIHTVIGMDELILRESKDDRIKTYATDIKSAGNMLLSLVNDILDFSKIGAGKMKILPASYQLSSMLTDLVNVIYMQAIGKGLEFHVNVDETTPAQLYGDVVRIKQVILNLLTNAVKYTQHGSIELHVSYEKKSDNEIELIVAVKDTGVGIKSEDMEKLYEQFARIEEIKNRLIEGTGLGMNIVKQLLELMSGRISVESSYGKGSCFTIRIPQGVEGNACMGPFSDAFKQELYDIKNYQHKIEKTSNGRVLVVDDNKTNRVIARELLNGTGIIVDLADSGEQMLHMIKQQRYDIIFIDHMMPGMDGIEALHMMKQGDHLCEQSVTVALTANAMSDAREQYINVGFDDFLSKPLNPVKYEELINKYLKNRAESQK